MILMLQIACFSNLADSVFVMNVTFTPCFFISLTDDLCDQVETGRQEMKALIDQHHVENETILSQVT